MTDRTPSLLPDDDVNQANGPVECLGMTFESDEARRTYFESPDIKVGRSYTFRKSRWR